MRGWPTEKVDGKWVFSDTGESVEVDRQCASCWRPSGGIEQPDPCLGTLPGVKYACCGHGDPHGAYIMFENGVVIRGFTVERTCRDAEES